MVALLVPWYRSDSPRHNSELLGALFENLQSPGVDRLILVCDGDAPPVHHQRLEVVEHSGRPTFWDLFELARGLGPFAIVNADCSVIDARHIATLEHPDWLWVTRWSIRRGEPCGAARRYALDWGADLFAFPRVPDHLPHGPWAPGEVFCDRALGVAMRDAGYVAHNRPWAVPCLHYHAERVRGEDERRPASGKYVAFSVRPEIDGRSPLWSEPFEQKVP
jgi:hypothetical protein